MNGIEDMKIMKEAYDCIMGDVCGCWDVTKSCLEDIYSKEELKEMLNRSFNVSISPEAVPVFASGEQDPLDESLVVIKRYPFKTCSDLSRFFENMGSEIWMNIGEGTRMSVVGSDHERIEVTFHQTVSMESLESLLSKYGLEARYNCPGENLTVDIYQKNGSRRYGNTYLASINLCQIPEQVCDIIADIICMYGSISEYSLDCDLYEYGGRMYFSARPFLKQLRLDPMSDVRIRCEFDGHTIETDAHISNGYTVAVGKILKPFGAVAGSKVSITVCTA